MLESCQFKIKLRNKDIINYAITHYFKRMKVFNFILISFMIAAFLFSLVVALGSEGEFRMPISLIAFPTIYIANIIVIALGTLYSFNKDSLSKYENIYILDDKTIVEKSIKMNTELEWCDIRRVLETKKLFLFYRSSNKAYIFPKDQLEREEVYKIRYFTAKNIGKKERKLLAD